mmetsp:Transcript_5730/g.24309  ORF Transcript_5730/g.24309 Transcript_5730/m.24309 type:complete len:200 (+) Transcript_5730:214-813(+)
MAAYSFSLFFSVSHREHRAARSASSTGSPTVTCTWFKTENPHRPYFLTCSIPECQNGKTVGFGPPLFTTSQTIFPNPHFKRPNSFAFLLTRPSGNKCSQSPFASRSLITSNDRWCSPPPRLTGTVLPAVKNLCTAGDAAQISRVHMVHRTPSCLGSVAKYHQGMRYDSTPGSSNVELWLETVMRPCGRSRSVMWCSSVS